jgi:hypothetical protein
MMTFHHLRTGFSAALCATASLAGCAIETSDGAEFREAVPKSEAVRVAGPEDSSASSAPGGSLQSESAPWAGGPWAEYYAFTRHVRDGINQVTVRVLGAVWFVVHTEPTEIGAQRATWGPWTDDLSPATYRFVVVREDDGAYHYSLQGRPRASTDGAFENVLDGIGYGKADARHGQGWFTIDVSKANQLDPQKNPEEGQFRIDHQLPNNIDEQVGALPRTITARAAEAEVWWTATSHQTAQGGTLLVEAHADLDQSKATLLEDIAIASQWQSNGSGRADITLSGGDIPSGIGVVTAVECWGTDFMRSYYSDSVQYRPTEGVPTACAFQEPPAP